MSQKICSYITYLCISFFVIGAVAQTVTTNGGSTNSVPKFSSATTIVDSAITENNGTVTVQSQRSLLLGTEVCCGAGPTGSSIGSNAGWSSGYNSFLFNSNGTADGDSINGAQINTALPSWRMTLGSGTQEWGGGDTFAIGRVAAGGNYLAPSVLLKVDASGQIHTVGGIVFPDGSLQTKAQLVGPQGPVGPTGATGPQGPPGSSTHNIAICVQGPNNSASCSCAVRLITGKFAPDVAGGSSCNVTSDTGSCSASGNFGPGFDFSGACCVCAVN